MKEGELTISGNAIPRKEEGRGGERRERRQADTKLRVCKLQRAIVDYFR